MGLFEDLIGAVKIGQRQAKRSAYPEQDGQGDHHHDAVQPVFFPGGLHRSGGIDQRGTFRIRWRCGAGLSWKLLQAG